MMNYTLLEILAELREAELRQRWARPLPPPERAVGTGLRHRLAQGLVGLGLRLDAEASRAVIGSHTPPRLNGSDA